MKNLFCSFFLLLSLAPLAQADVLLVIASSDGLFSENKTFDHGMELLGAEFIKTGLADQYREVIIHTEKSDKQMTTTLSQLARSLRPNEKIDIFSKQHGPVSTPFIDLPVEDALRILPPNSVRNIYNTACSEWGSVRKMWGSFARFTGTPLRQSEDAYALLNPEFYALHANDNYSGYLTLALMMKELRQDGDWARASNATFKKYDLLATDLIKDVADAINDSTLEMVIGKSLVDRLQLVMGKVLQSRVVLNSKSPLSFENDWRNETGGNGYYSMMVSPDQATETQWNQWCGLQYKQNMLCRFTGNNQPGGIRRAMVKTMDFLHDTFLSLSAQGNGCISPAFVNVFLKTYLDSDQVALKRLCLNKTRKGHRLTWEWKNRFDLAGIEGIEHIDRLQVRKQGRLEVIGTDNDLRIRFAGVTTSVKGVLIDPTGVTIKDSGESQVHTQLAGVVPLRIGASSVQNLTMPEFVKLFGIKVWNGNN